MTGIVHQILQHQHQHFYLQIAPLFPPTEAAVVILGESDLARPQIYFGLSFTPLGLGVQ
jgi:hypothetical protein